MHSKSIRSLWGLRMQLGSQPQSNMVWDGVEFQHDSKSNFSNLSIMNLFLGNFMVNVTYPHLPSKKRLNKIKALEIVCQIEVVSILMCDKVPNQIVVYHSMMIYNR